MSCLIGGNYFLKVVYLVCRLRKLVARYRKVLFIGTVFCLSSLSSLCEDYFVSVRHVVNMQPTAVPCCCQLEFLPFQFRIAAVRLDICQLTGRCRNSVFQTKLVFVFRETV